MGSGRCRVTMQQKIKQDICLGHNIRRIRKSKNIGQTEFVHLLQLHGCDITRESLVKIERCIQHIRASQLIAIKEVLETSFEELFTQEEAGNENEKI